MPQTTPKDIERVQAVINALSGRAYYAKQKADVAALKAVLADAQALGQALADVERLKEELRAANQVVEWINAHLPDPPTKETTK